MVKLFAGFARPTPASLIILPPLRSLKSALPLTGMLLRNFAYPETTVPDTVVSRRAVPIGAMGRLKEFPVSPSIITGNGLPSDRVRETFTAAGTEPVLTPTIRVRIPPPAATCGKTDAEVRSPGGRYS